MRKALVVAAVGLSFLCTSLTRVSLAKDVTAQGAITALEDDGKQMTFKTEAGEEVTCKVSSKRTKFSKKDLEVGKKVTVVYDDENPAKEARSIAPVE